MGSELYDAIDLKNSYRSGFWIGTVTGLTGMFILALAVGVFINS